MSGRRLAKRSIIGTKVCAPGPDGLWYSGVIQDVKTPPCSTITSTTMDQSDVSNSDTKYIVRFDFKTQSTIESPTPMDARRNIHISPTQAIRRNAMIKEFRETDLIGPGFRSIIGIQLQPGQRVYLTYSGRETSGDVVNHDLQNDEVTIKITAIGVEEPIEVKKRLEEVRLLESRRSARLADQERDTDFARLADMGGDRRKTSHSIEVPCTMWPSHNSRKRPTSYTHDCYGDECNEMNECHAAMILMRLHNSPKTPTYGDKWLGSSPGSSSASWSSGSSSPPLSDDGQPIHSSRISTEASARIRTTSVSTSDEGIVVDYTEEVPRKKKASRFLCRWKGCNFVENALDKIESHVRNVHLGKKKVRKNDHEEEFYFTEEEDEDEEEEDDEIEQTTNATSPPTLSHRDMARPPHEDPEYQRQIVGNFKQGRQYQQIVSNSKGYNTNTQIGNNNQHINSNSAICTPTAPLVHHNYTWPQNSMPISSTPISHSPQTHNQVTYIRHSRSSPRPSQSTGPYPSPNYVHQQHHNYSSSPNSSNSSGSNQSSPTLYGSNCANNVLQQLSQQNITITTHHNSISTQHNGSQPQMSTVTITPNFQTNQNQHQTQHPHQHQQQHQQTLKGYQHQQSNGSTASNMIANQAAQTNIQQQTHHNVVQHVAASTKPTPNSPNRRTRGENKKCRKVYGMDRRDQWCTQCKWKKACTRFGD